jgi:hypothetical protein
MAEARCRERWEHTSVLLALIANCHRDPRRKPTPYKPADFNPYQSRQEPLVQTVPIEVLKQVFVDRR